MSRPALCTVHDISVFPNQQGRNQDFEKKIKDYRDGMKKILTEGTDQQTNRPFTQGRLQSERGDLKDKAKTFWEACTANKKKDTYKKKIVVSLAILKLLNKDQYILYGFWNGNQGIPKSAREDKPYRVARCQQAHSEMQVCVFQNIYVIIRSNENVQ